MDLYSRRIVGCLIDQRMTQGLVNRAIIQAVNLRQPRCGLVFHSDRGGQYISGYDRELLAGYGMRPSMGNREAC